MITLKTRAEFIIANTLQIAHSDGCDIEYNGSKIAVSANFVEPNKIDEQPAFDIASTESRLYIFALLDSEEWKYFLLPTSVIKTTFGKESSVSLELIKPMAVQTDDDNLRSAVDLVLAA